MIEALKAYVQRPPEVKDIYVGLKEMQNELSFLGVVIIEGDFSHFQKRVFQDIGTICTDLLNEVALDLQISSEPKEEWAGALVSVLELV